MASSFQNSVTDFDLNFLDNEPKNQLIPNKALRKTSVTYLKKKLILTDSLINKYNASRDVNDHLEKSLLSSQDECKDVCIKYKHSTEKCSKLENEIEQLQNANKVITAKCFNLENQYQALQSHIHQLQVLVTEYETQISTLKQENKTFKESKHVENVYEKKLAKIKKENNLYTTHLVVFTEVITKKRKLGKSVKALLENYEKYSKDRDIHTSDYDDSDIENEEFEEVADTMCDDDDLPEPNIVQENITATDFGTESKEIEEPVTDIPVVKRDKRIDSGNNCAQSVDTGRGSSLAFSDGEKSFHSPDYYMSDSPLSIHSHDLIKTFNDASTSPIFNNRSIATSPISFGQYLKISTTERAVSPILVMECTKTASSKKQIRLKDVAVNTQSITKSEAAKNNDMENDFSMQYEEPYERKCLELNNSKKLHYNQQDDSEIEMILNTMKLDHRIITPIPLTPSKMKSMQRLRSPSFNSIIEHNEEPEPRINDITLKKIDDLYEMVQSLNQQITRCDSDFIINISKHVVKQIENNSINVRPKSLLAKIKKKDNEPAETTIDIESHPDVDLDCFNRPELATSAQVIHIEQDPNVKETDLIENINEEGGIENVNEIDLGKGNNIDPMERDMDLHIENDYSDCDDPITLVFPDSEDENVHDKIEHIQEAHKNKTDINLDQPSDIHDSNSANIDKFVEYSKHLQVQELPNEMNTECVNSVKKLEKDTGNSKKKVLKRRKLSKLERMRHKLLPKSKIKISRQTKISKKCRFRPKAILRQATKLTLTSSQNKSAYEKAVKIMAELKSQSPKKVPKVIVEDCLNSKILSPQKDLSRESYIGLKVNLANLDLAYKLELNKKPPVIDTNDKADLKETNITKRISVNAAETEANEPKRVLRPRQQSKSDGNEVIRDPLLNNGYTNLSPIKANSNRVSPTKAKSNCMSPKTPSAILSPTKINHTNVSPQKTLSINNSPIPTNGIILSPIKTNGIILSPSKTTSISDLPPKRKSISNETSPQVNNKTGKRKRRDTLSRHSSDNDNEASNDCKSPRAKRNQTTEDVLTEDPPVCKRILRSSSTKQDSDHPESPNKIETSGVTTRRSSVRKSLDFTKNNNVTPPKEQNLNNNYDNILSYADLDLYTDDKQNHGRRNTEGELVTPQTIQPKDSLMCAMIEKHGVQVVCFSAKKTPDAKVDKICNLLVEKIAKINELNSPENKDAMNNLVVELQCLDIKELIAGFKKYFQDPDRKNELFKVVISPPAPSMTKSEQVLLYVIAELRHNWEGIDFVEEILSNMEYVLFSLHRTPEFGVVESMSHFYAILCRYYRLKSRLRLFMLDAMYCMQFKSVPLIKQCLEVWMHIIPLAHMGIAKSPLVTSLIYLLHFYKCDDRFKRVNEIRIILASKYHYKITEWNETKILELFNTSIKELKEDKMEKKMLRLSLILLAKRNGTKWCHNNIIKNMLLPMIEKKNVSNRVKQFCLSMLGPLMKPYPIDMKVHCEVVCNQLFDMVEEKQPQGMWEAITTSLIYLCKNNNRIYQYLLKCPNKKVSPEFEAFLKDYVKTKPLKVWKTILGNIRLS